MYVAHPSDFDGNKRKNVDESSGVGWTHGACNYY